MKLINGKKISRLEVECLLLFVMVAVFCFLHIFHFHFDIDILYGQLKCERFRIAILEKKIECLEKDIIDIYAALREKDEKSRKYEALMKEIGEFFLLLLPQLADQDCPGPGWAYRFKMEKFKRQINEIIPLEEKWKK